MKPHVPGKIIPVLDTQCKRHISVHCGRDGMVVGNGTKAPPWQIYK